MASSVIPCPNVGYTYLGKLTAVGDEVTIPTHNRIYVRLDVNNYYYSPLIEIDNAPRCNFPVCITSWLAVIELELSNKLIWKTEETISGTKPPTWTTSIDVYIQ